MVSPTFSQLSNGYSLKTKTHLSCLEPLYQSEALCTTIYMKMSFIYMLMKSSFWRDAKGNSEMAYSD